MPDIAEIARAVIRNHPPDCVFRPDTVWLCIQACRGLASEREVIDAIATTIVNCEIYCPHEGIDRRAEFGVTR